MSEAQPSAFDANQFLQATVEGANEVNYTPVPVGDYTAVCSDVSCKRTTDEGTPILDITWTIDDPKLAEELGREKVTITQGVFVDINENGTIAFGPNKNVTLGRLREALGQNDPKKAWAPKMMEGKGPVMIHVEHDPDKKDPTRVYDRVKRVAAMA